MLSVFWLKSKRMLQEAPMYVIMMLMAIVLSFIFGVAIFGGSAQRVYIVDYSDSEFTQDFLDFLNENKTYSFEILKEDKATSNVQRGEGIAAIVIPEGFGEEGNTLNIIITTESIEVMTLKNFMSDTYARMRHLDFLHGYIEEEKGEEVNFADVVVTYNEQMGENSLVKTLFSILGAGNRDTNYENNIHFMMGFNIFFVLFSIIFTIGTILEDKQLKIWRRMKISPLNNFQILAGNFIPTYAIGLFQMAIVLLVGQFMYNMDLGNAIYLIFAVFSVYVLTATCLGLFLSALLKNYEQLNSLAPIVLVSTSMLGGTMWPLEIINSELMLTIANFTPQRWAMLATREIAVYGAEFTDIIKPLAVLLLMAFILFSASILIMKKKDK